MPNNDEQLKIALHHAALADASAALAEAGGPRALIGSVKHRLQAEIRDGKLVTWAQGPTGNSRITLAELISELKALVPNAFPTAAAPLPRVEVIPLAKWTDKVARATLTERAELLRKAGAGKVRISP